MSLTFFFFLFFFLHTCKHMHTCKKNQLWSLSYASVFKKNIESFWKFSILSNKPVSLLLFLWMEQREERNQVEKRDSSEGRVLERSRIRGTCNFSKSPRGKSTGCREYFVSSSSLHCQRDAYLDVGKTVKKATFQVLCLACRWPRKVWWLSLPVETIHLGPYFSLSLATDRVNASLVYWVSLFNESIEGDNEEAVLCLVCPVLFVRC